MQFVSAVGFLFLLNIVVLVYQVMHSDLGTVYSSALQQE